MNKCKHSIEQGLSNFDMYWVILERFLLTVICLFYIWIYIFVCECWIYIIFISCTPATSFHSCSLHFLSSLWLLFYYYCYICNIWIHVYIYKYILLSPWSIVIMYTCLGMTILDWVTHQWAHPWRMILPLSAAISFL